MKTQQPKRQGQLIPVLDDPNVQMAIFRDAARFEDLMLLVICIYFTPQSRSHLFLNLFSDILSFNQRIEILKNLPFKKRPKSLECIHTIQLVQRLRNHMAHRAMITRKKTDITAESRVRELFSNYPRSYELAVWKANKQLHRIGAMKEVLQYHLGGP